MKFLPLAVVLLACSCARPEPWERPGERYTLCQSHFGSFDKIQAMLERHGIECFWWGGTLGSQDVIVVGRETAFQARQVVLENAGKEEELFISWQADVYVLDAEPEFQRVAEVTVESASTREVVDLLECRGVSSKFYFGSREDRIVVSRHDVRDALAILREKPIPGLSVMPPQGF